MPRAPRTTREPKPIWTWDMVEGLDPLTRAIATKDHLSLAWLIAPKPEPEDAP